MKFPVVIAAHNEQDTIGRTLHRLDASLFEPVVITNGCDDDTAKIAREYGVEVIEREEKGKLPAIQDGLRLLGSRALDPVFYTDADSYPLSNRLWKTTMLSAIEGERAQFISGPVGYVDGNSGVDNLFRTVRRQFDVRNAKRQGFTHCFGANIVSRFADPETLDKVLELPHIWPGEDHAMEDLVVKAGGEKIQITDPRATVMTSARYLPTVGHVLRVGQEQARKEILEFYNERAAPDSITYGQYRKRLRRRAKQKV